MEWASTLPPASRRSSASSLTRSALSLVYILRPESVNLSKPQDKGRLEREPRVSIFSGNNNTSTMFSMEDKTVQSQPRFQTAARILIDLPKGGDMRIIGLPFTVHDAPMDIGRYSVEGYSQLLPYIAGSSLSTN